MDKPFSDSIQSLSAKELALVFSILPEREITKPMRDALVFRYDSGFSVSFSARRFGVDRGALSKAENKVLDVWSKILAHIESE